MRRRSRRIEPSGARYLTWRLIIDDAVIYVTVRRREKELVWCMPCRFCIVNGEVDAHECKGCEPDEVGSSPWVPIGEFAPQLATQLSGNCLDALLVAHDWQKYFAGQEHRAWKTIHRREQLIMRGARMAWDETRSRS